MRATAWLRAAAVAASAERGRGGPTRVVWAAQGPNQVLVQGQVLVQVQVLVLVLVLVKEPVLVLVLAQAQVLPSLEDPAHPLVKRPWAERLHRSRRTRS